VANKFVDFDKQVCGNIVKSKPASYETKMDVVADEVSKTQKSPSPQ